MHPIRSSSDLLSRLHQVPDDARRVGLVMRRTLEVGIKTGLLAHATPRGAAIMALAIARNRATPSALYRFQAATQGSKIAIRSRHRNLTFAELDREIDQIGNGLLRRGFKRGDRAILMLKNRAEFVALQPAMSRIGSAGVSISWRSTPDELVYLANHSGARAMFFERDLAPVVERALPQMKTIERDAMFVVGGRTQGFATYEELLSEGVGGRGQEGDEAAVIIYTSGTTGKPKGAVRRFPRDLVLGTLDLINVSPLRTDDVHLAVLPFYHSTAFAFTSFTHLVGGSVVILDEFTPEGFLATIEAERVTQTAVVPTLLHRVLKLGRGEIWRYDTRSLRAIITAGAPLTGSMAAQVMDVFGDILWNYYGATETGLNTVAGPKDLRASPGTIGRLIPGNEIRLLDDAGRVVAPGQVGEIFIRGPMMVAGYHGDEEATKSSQREGFFSVGDLGWLDARGCYHIAGRKRDMIISGGVNVYPAEVESVLESHPAVSEAAVIGVPDDEWGESVKAFVVLREGDRAALVDSVSAFARAKLAGPKRPREYVVLDALPHNPTGKVIKTELRNLGSTL